MDNVALLAIWGSDAHVSLTEPSLSNMFKIRVIHNPIVALFYFEFYGYTH